MSDEITKHPLNVKGRYYIDQDCCTCSAVCVYDAPANFKADDMNSVYVFKQPSTPDEEAQCKQAMEDCPVEAIFNDGEA